MYFQFVIAIFVILFLYVKNVRTLEPLLGIYRESSKYFYLKFCAMYVLLTLRKRKTGDIEELEKRQPLTESAMAVDAVYFHGVSTDKCILALATAQRRNNRVNAFAILRIPEFSNQILVSPKWPDSTLIQIDDEYKDDRNYAVEGIKLTPIIPMRTWKLNYNGKMKFEKDHSKTFNVKIDAIWTTNLPHFNFDSEIHPRTVAKAMAMEPWSSEYFKNLERFHQTHYEQHGDIRGTATIDGKDYQIFTNSMRDHSFADLRDWKNFHRYAMHFLTLDNGDRLTVGIICVPVMFSSVVVGFITKAKLGVNHAISDCDFKLYQHGEEHNPPTDYGFTFWAGGERYVVQAHGYEKVEFYIGADAEGRLVEQYTTCTVNGVRGWGFVEWNYRHVDGLPK